MLDPGCLSLDAGYWFLDTCHLLLVTDLWLIEGTRSIPAQKGSDYQLPTQSTNQPENSINPINYELQSRPNRQPATYNSHFASSIEHQFFNRIALARMDHSRGTSIVTVAVRSIR